MQIHLSHGLNSNNQLLFFKYIRAFSLKLLIEPYWGKHVVNWSPFKDPDGVRGELAN